MKSKIIIIYLLFVNSFIFSGDLSFFKTYYPKEPFIYYFNDELKSVVLINDGPFGHKKEIYSFEKIDNTLTITNPNNERFEVIFYNSSIQGSLYDDRGLWQTFNISIDKNKIEHYVWEHRYMVEGREEPLMIKDENYFKYTGKYLTKHERPTEYRSRTFNYEDGKLIEIKNILGNGEESEYVTDKFIYTDDYNYTVSPCSELSFYSIHFPVMDKKVHSVEFVNGIEVITDTYFYNGEVYFEYIEEWNKDKIISLSTYIGFRKNTAKFIFTYHSESFISKLKSWFKRSK